jgi:hypothetical protein
MSLKKSQSKKGKDATLECKVHLLGLGKMLRVPTWGKYFVSKSYNSYFWGGSSQLGDLESYDGTETIPCGRHGGDVSMAEPTF